MGKLIVTEFVTLDGVAQAPGGPDEDRRRRLQARRMAGATVGPGDRRRHFRAGPEMDALLLGRRTYEIFAGYWPTAPEEIPFTGLLNGVPKYVASRTLATLWPGTARRFSPSPSPRASLAEGAQRGIPRHRQPQPCAVPAAFRPRRPAEPVALPAATRQGKKVFDDGTLPTALRLTESVTYTNGTLHLAYETLSAAQLRRPHHMATTPLGTTAIAAGIYRSSPRRVGRYPSDGDPGPGGLFAQLAGTAWSSCTIVPSGSGSAAPHADGVRLAPSPGTLEGS